MFCPFVPLEKGFETELKKVLKRCKQGKSY